MQRQQNTELGLKCTTCKEVTNTTEPIIFKKIKENRINIYGLCGICKRLKMKTLNKLQRALIPDEIRNMEVGKEINNQITRDGGILPLATLIPLILGGITALSSTAGTVAGTV